MNPDRVAAAALLVVASACGPRVILSEDGGGSSSANEDANTSTSGAGTTLDPGTTVPGDPRPTTGPGSATDGSTTTPTTAGEDGGTPGGAGPDGTPDVPGDVDLPAADVIAAAVYTDGALLDFRAQLATSPFGVEATPVLTWCISAGTGSQPCAMQASNITHYLMAIFYQSGHLEVQEPDAVDGCLHGAFETETNTFRILVPKDLVTGTSEFQWLLGVSFGGSGGDHEYVPDVGALDVVVVDVLPPFSGEPTCD